MKEQTYEIQIEEIPITVMKRRMKNMYLRIRGEDGRVLISAPHQVGRQRIEQFARERIDWIREHREKYEAQSRERAAEPQPDDAEIEKRKILLKAAAWRLVKEYEPWMGVQVSGITIRQMKTRWGSCNVKTHHINLNLALYEKAPEYLEYVVVHEMCHILEASHNQVFWGYVTQYYPDWKAVRKRMRQEEIR